jgi:hypothetical protein
MKKIIYFTALCAIFVVVVIVCALLSLATRLEPYYVFGFGYSLGSAAGNPPLWIISLGITLLIRKTLYKAVFKCQKQFNKGAGVFCIVFGVIWLSIGIGMKMLNSYTEKKLLNYYEQTE